MLHHIALSIKRSDLKAFYIKLLGGKVIDYNTLVSEQMYRIFNIPQAVEVYYVEIDQTIFELFIHDTPLPVTYNHHCLVKTDAADVFQKAYKKHYPVYRRAVKTKETFFIRDKNGNLFELKTDKK